MTVAASVPSEVLQYLAKGIQSSAKVKWGELADAYMASDWVKVGEISLEDALTVASPFIPEAAMAEFFLKLAFAVGGDVASSISGRPIDIQDVIKSCLIAEGVDWSSLGAAIASHDPAKIGILVLDDILKIASPFLLGTPVSIILPVLNLLVFVGSFKDTGPRTHLRWGASDDPYDPDCLYGGGPGD